MRTGMGVQLRAGKAAHVWLPVANENRPDPPGHPFALSPRSWSVGRYAQELPRPALLPQDDEGHQREHGGGGIAHEQVLPSHG